MAEGLAHERLPHIQKAPNVDKQRLELFVCGEAARKRENRLDGEKESVVI